MAKIETKYQQTWWYFELEFMGYTSHVCSPLSHCFVIAPVVCVILCGLVVYVIAYSWNKKRKSTKKLTK